MLRWRPLLRAMLLSAVVIGNCRPPSGKSAPSAPAHEGAAGLTTLCREACTKLVRCWQREAGSLGYGYSSGPREEAAVAGETSPAARAKAAYGLALRSCMRGCAADPQGNASQIECLRQHACPELLPQCLGVDTRASF